MLLITILNRFHKQFLVFPQNSSITLLNFWGISIFTQCPAFSKITTFNWSSLLFQSSTAFNSIGISNFPHPLSIKDTFLILFGIHLPYYSMMPNTKKISLEIEYSYHKSHFEPAGKRQIFFYLLSQTI